MAAQRGSRRSHIRDRCRRYRHVDRIVQGRHEVQSDHAGPNGSQIGRHHVSITREIRQEEQNGCRSFSAKGFYLSNRTIVIFNEL